MFIATVLATLASAAGFGVPLVGVIMALGVVIATLLMFSAPWRTTGPLAPLSLDTLSDHARLFQKVIWWRNARESLAAVVVLLLNTRDLWRADSQLARTGNALLIAGMLFIIWFLHFRAGSRAVPGHAEAKDVLRFHQREIARQRDILRAVPLWYLLPFVPGMVAIAANKWETSSAAGALVGVPVIIGVFALVWRLNVWAARGLDRRAAQGRRARGTVMSSTARTVARIIGSALASWVLAIAAATSAAAQSPATPSPVPSDAEIRKILVERVDTHRQSVGIVVGVIEPGGRRIVAYGSRAKGDTRPLDGDTVFEIGSITKVFTSLLLADAVRRGEVALGDPVAKYLPPEVKMPERGGRAITLQDLATHTSGLPRMPDNFQPKDLANPYADYSVERMYQFLSRYQLTRDAGATVEYSNLGVGLLGHVLARRAGMDYETLVRTRVTGPLGMRHTGIALSPEMQARLAPGHSPVLEPVPNWDLPTFAGAGALRSSANDMLTFLAAALGYGSSPLDSAFATMLSTRRPPSSTAALDTALGWQIFKGKDTEVIWHNGGTGGYRTWAGYEPRSRTGVVVLTNAGTAAGPDDIGRHLLVPSSPLLQNFPPQTPPKPRTQTTVDAAVFDRYVGRYQLAPSAVLTITRDGNRFFVQLTGQPTFEIFAESEKDYFLKVVDAQLTFETDAQNKAVAVVLHQNGIDQRAPRIEGEPVIPKEIAVDPAVLESYVGGYQLDSGHRHHDYPAAGEAVSRN